MLRDGEVVLATLDGRTYSQVTPCLSTDPISISTEESGQFFSTDIPRELHAAMTSSLT